MLSDKGIKVMLSRSIWDLLTIVVEDIPTMPMYITVMCETQEPAVREDRTATADEFQHKRL